MMRLIVLSVGKSRLYIEFRSLFLGHICSAYFICVVSPKCETRTKEAVSIIKIRGDWVIGIPIMSCRRTTASILNNYYSLG